MKNLLPLALLGGAALLVMGSKKNGGSVKRHGYELVNGKCNHIRVYDVDATTRYMASEDFLDKVKANGIHPMKDVEPLIALTFESVFSQCKGRLPPENSFTFTDANGKDWDWEGLVEFNQKLIDLIFKGVGPGQMGGPDLVSGAIS